MDDVKEVLRREAERVTAPEDPVPRIMRRLARRRRRHRAMATVTALAVACTGFVVAYTAFVGQQLRPSSEPARVAQVTATVDVEGLPRDVVAGEGHVWVVSGLLADSDGEPIQASPEADVVDLEGPASQDAVLQAIDPASNEIVLRVSLREQLRRNVWPSIITVGSGAVWISESPGSWVHKVDPHTGRVVGSFEAVRRPSVLLAGSGALWYVADGDPRVDREPSWEGVLVKVDPETLDTVATIPIGPCCAGDLVEAEGSLWLGHQVVRDSEFTLEVLRIDPGTAEVVGQVPLDRDSWRPGDTLLGDMAASPGAVWVTRPEAGFVDRIDAPSAGVSERIPIRAFPVPDGAVWYAGYMWVGSLQTGRLARIDPDTNEVTAEGVDVPTIHKRAATDEGLWIVDSSLGTVIRVEAVSQATFGASPTAVQE